MSCKIEDFVETHLYKLRRILRSRVLRVLVTFKDLVLIEGNKKSNGFGTQGVYRYVAVDMYATLHVLVVRNIINSSRGGE